VNLLHNAERVVADAEDVTISHNTRLSEVALYSVADFYYRAMNFSAKRGIAITCRLSVCLSVCPSVCNVGEL